MPSGIGIQGVNEDKFEEAVEHNRQNGITLISTWSESDIRGFLGENLMRVYEANWK
jgi:microsomal dipeptidase-like Zn-dependent dipeptidase